MCNWPSLLLLLVYLLLLLILWVFYRPLPSIALVPLLLDFRFFCNVFLPCPSTAPVSRFKYPQIWSGWKSEILITNREYMEWPIFYTLYRTPVYEGWASDMFCHYHYFPCKWHAFLKSIRLFPDWILQSFRWNKQTQTLLVYTTRCTVNWKHKIAKLNSFQGRQFYLY